MPVNLVHWGMWFVWQITSRTHYDKSSTLTKQTTLSIKLFTTFCKVDSVFKSKEFVKNIISQLVMGWPKIVGQIIQIGVFGIGWVVCAFLYEITSSSSSMKSVKKIICNIITKTLIQISRLFYFSFFSKTDHQMMI